MLDARKEFLLKRIATLEAEKGRLTKLVTFQRDTIINLRNVGIGMRARIKELTAGI